MEKGFVIFWSEMQDTEKTLSADVFVGDATNFNE